MKFLDLTKLDVKRLKACRKSILIRISALRWWAPGFCDGDRQNLEQLETELARVNKALRKHSPPDERQYVEVLKQKKTPYMRAT